MSDDSQDRMAGATLAICGAFVLAAGLIVCAYIAWLPDAASLRYENPKTTQYIQIYVRRSLAHGRRPEVFFQWTPLNEISPYLRGAVLMAEDDRFYRHHGVDWQELKTAVHYDLRKRQFARGASTITQQVARNLYLSPLPSPARKLKEILIARYLERVLDKDRILEIYLNVAEWGEGVFGAEAASRAYYGKSASELDLGESIALAAALPSPYRLNPSRPPEERTLKKEQLYLERLRKRLKE